MFIDVGAGAGSRNEVPWSCGHRRKALDVYSKPRSSWNTVYQRFVTARKHEYSLDGDRGLRRDVKPIYPAVIPKAAETARDEMSGHRARKYPDIEGRWLNVWVGSSRSWTRTWRYTGFLLDQRDSYV